MWRREAVARLQSLAVNKRQLSQLSTPSPANRKKANKTHSLDQDDHTYSRDNLEAMTANCRTGVMHRAVRARRSLSVDTQNSTEVTFLEEIRNCVSLNDVITKTLGYAPSCEMIEDRLVLNIGSQLETLCTLGQYGSVLGQKNGDNNMGEIVEVALCELRKRVPLLYKTIVVALSQSSSKPDWSLFVIYGIILQHRSQKINVMQTLLTASCIRYHAGNQVFM